MTITIQLPTGERREFDQGSVLIGRGASCPIHLPEADHLREEHARLRKVADRWMVESRGDWAIQVGRSDPAKFGWLKPGDVIRLSQGGPELIFEPAHEDVVLASLEPLKETPPSRTMPPPLPPGRATSSQPPPLPGRNPTSVAPPPLPSDPGRSPPPLPSATENSAAPPPLPGQLPSHRPIPPPLPRADEVDY